MMAAEQEENVKFVECVEQYPCLYDHRIKSYSNKTATEKAWNEISKEFKITVKECKDKWKNIRTVFRRHLYTKPPSGSGASTSKKDYYLADVLHFLVPILTGKNQQLSNLLDPNSSEQSTNFEMSEQTFPAEQTPAFDVDEPGDCTVNNGSENPAENTITTASPNITDFRSSVVRNKRKNNDALDNAMTQYFKSKVSTPKNIETSASVSDERFLLSLKEDMAEMTPLQKRRFKRRIYDVIDDVLGSGPYASSSSASMCNRSAPASQYDIPSPSTSAASASSTGCTAATEYQPSPSLLSPYQNTNFNYEFL